MGFFVVMSEHLLISPFSSVSTAKLTPAFKGEVKQQSGSAIVEDGHHTNDIFMELKV